MQISQQASVMSVFPELRHLQVAYSSSTVVYTANENLEQPYFYMQMVKVEQAAIASYCMWSDLKVCDNRSEKDTPDRGKDPPMLCASINWASHAFWQNKIIWSSFGGHPMFWSNMNSLSIDQNEYLCDIEKAR